MSILPIWPGWLVRDEHHVVNPANDVLKIIIGGILPTDDVAVRYVLAGGLVRKDPVQDLAFVLAQLVLVHAAHPNVADPLTIHGGLQSMSL